MKKLFMFLFFLILSLGISYAGDYKIENISMVENSAGYITTRGMIRNLGTTPFRGYVEIDFVNTTGDVVYSMNAYVNKKRDIPPGKAAFFENTIHRDSAPGVKSVQVKFIER